MGCFPSFTMGEGEIRWSLGSLPVQIFGKNMSVNLSMCRVGLQKKLNKLLHTLMSEWCLRGTRDSHE